MKKAKGGAEMVKTSFVSEAPHLAKLGNKHQHGVSHRLTRFCSWVHGEQLL